MHTQRSILITGCSSGIGYDVAHGLKRAGWRVFAACRQKKDVDRLAQEGLETVLLDYADSATIDATLEKVLAKTGGKLDALYNNGAFACPGAVEDLPRGALESVFQTNVFGLHELTTKVIPVMRAQGHGRIINCSSVLGLVPMKWRGAYVASKFALEGLTQTLRIEMRDTPIKVILIQPGPVTSDIRKNSIPHFERWINWEGSARSEQYRTSLLKRLYEESAPDRFELPPSAVTAKILKALESPSPRPNYFVTTPTYLMSSLRRILPACMLDALIAKS
jgi:NAD(P)-dependent dehydrogenase (short-subunit alcohol dehydrogenase family)